MLVGIVEATIIQLEPWQEPPLILSWAIVSRHLWAVGVTQTVHTFWFTILQTLTIKKTQMCLFRARICVMHQRMWQSRCQQHKEAEFQNLSLLSRPSYLNSRRRKYLKSIWWLEKRSLNITKVTTGIRSYYRWRETMQDGLPWGLEGCLDSKQWVRLLQGVWRSVCMSGCNFSAKGSDTLF